MYIIIAERTFKVENIGIAIATRPIIVQILFQYLQSSLFCQ